MYQDGTSMSAPAGARGEQEALGTLAKARRVAAHATPPRPPASTAGPVDPAALGCAAEVEGPASRESPGAHATQGPGTRLLRCLSVPRPK